MRARLDELTAEEAVLRGETERLEAELPAAEAALRSAEDWLAELATAGAPLEVEVEAAKDHLVDGLAQETRLGNLGEALRQRRQDLDGRRRKLEDEQRDLGERLHANEKA